MFRIKKKIIYVVLLALAVFIIWAGRQIILFPKTFYPEVYFLNVGQGDSALILLPDNTGSFIRILIDGGRDKKVLNELDKALAAGDKYIDLVVMTHTDLDHLGGLVSVADRYKIGGVVFNGREKNTNAFISLKNILIKHKTPFINLSAGDKIKYLASQVDVLSPDRLTLNDKNENETGLVLMLKTNNKKVLFTADIGFKTEKYLLDRYDLKVDALKVGHHGSKYSSGNDFINAARPKISVISVGKNSYGHPTDRVLKTLEQFGSLIYRTDLNGTIKLILN